MVKLRPVPLAKAGAMADQEPVALVTGATRGVRRGVALGLLEAGMRVHATGRTISFEGFAPAEPAFSSAFIDPRQIDHADDAQTRSVSSEKTIAREGRLDLLVNNAWPGYEHMVEGGRFTWADRLWDQPMWRWDAMIGVGLRAAYCCSRLAAKQMAAQRRGLIVNISYWAARKFMQNVAYGVSKAATDKLTADLAVQLREFGVAAVSLYPGLVRTEAVLQFESAFDLSNSESPQFQGRAVAGLYSDLDRIKKSGGAFTSADLALEYGFADVDGRQPRPLTLETA